MKTENHYIIKQNARDESSRKNITILTLRSPCNSSFFYNIHDAAAAADMMGVAYIPADEKLASTSVAVDLLLYFSCNHL